MIIPIRVKVQKLINFGKKYPWPKPAKCPKCDSCRLWGHGYVWRYFECLIESIEGLWLKRWLCPECGAVHTMRPDLYWPRFQYKTSKILSGLKNRVNLKHWLKDMPRQNQQYWFKGLKKQAAYYYPHLKTITLELINLLLKKRIILSSQALLSATLRL